MTARVSDKARAEAFTRALVIETSRPGMFVQLWRIAERMSLLGPKLQWPALIPLVNELEAGELIRVRREKRLGGETLATVNANAGIMYRGVLVFDPTSREAIIPVVHTADDTKLASIDSVLEALDVAGIGTIAITQP